VAKLSPFDQSINGSAFQELRRELLTGNLRKVCVECPSRVLPHRTSSLRHCALGSKSIGSSHLKFHSIRLLLGDSVMSFPLFTSIKPPANAHDLSYLLSCIASWGAAGFRSP
jgi:hypothetical protein